MNINIMTYEQLYNDPPPPPLPYNQGVPMLIPHHMNPPISGKEHTPYLRYWLLLVITKKNTPFSGLSRFPEKMRTCIRVGSGITTTLSHSYPLHSWPPQTERPNNPLNWTSPSLPSTLFFLHLASSNSPLHGLYPPATPLISFQSLPPPPPPHKRTRRVSFGGLKSLARFFFLHCLHKNQVVLPEYSLIFFCP